MIKKLDLQFAESSRVQLFLMASTVIKEVHQLFIGHISLIIFFYISDFLR